MANMAIFPTKNSLLGEGYKNLASLRTNNKNKKITYKAM